MKRFLWLGFVLFFYLICSGCGETFRQVIIPNPPTFPNPAAAHSVVSLNDNGAFVQGSAMSIDVSGDSVESIANVDIHPVHAAQQSASEVLVLNQAVTGLGVPTSACLVTIQPNNQVFDVCPSLTMLNFSGTSIGSTNTITLPIYSSPNFVAVAPSATTAYVTLPTYPPNPLDPQTIVPSVGVINTTSRALAATVPVGSTAAANPYAMAVTRDNTKLYVANQGDGTVNGFTVTNTVGLTARTINGTFNAPVWVSARSDSQRVYVLNGNGVVSTMDTTSTAGPDTVIDASINAPGASSMVYDGNTNRLYIPYGSQLTMLDVSQSIPAVITGLPIAIPTVAPGSRSAGDPCFSTTTATLHTDAVAALPDGSRAYVGSYYEDASGNICPQVTVIDAVSNSIKSYFAVPGFAAYDALCANTRFRFTMAAGGDSSRAYLASCDGGMVNIVDTSTDSYLENQPAPASTRNTNPPGPQNLPQNPVFLIAGP
jgi:hypothetical protein